ncbi:MAG TPA: hypothetical protein V6C89_10420 [Drouetiella sp.]
MTVSILVGSLWNPIHAEARGWQQWVQEGASIVRRGAQIRNQAAGYVNGNYHQAPQESPYQPSAGSGSPGSNYYNIDPATMRNPLKHAEPPPPQEQPAYTAPPTYQPSYTRSAYRTGSDAGSEHPPGQRMSGYAAKRSVHAHTVVKHVEKPEKAMVVVHSSTAPKPEIIDKPDVLKPATALDTSWILPTVDRVAAKLHSKG